MATYQQLEFTYGYSLQSVLYVFSATESQAVIRAGSAVRVQIALPPASLSLPADNGDVGFVLDNEFGEAPPGGTNTFGQGALNLPAKTSWSVGELRALGGVVAFDTSTRLAFGPGPSYLVAMTSLYSGGQLSNYPSGTITTGPRTLSVKAGGSRGYFAAPSS